MKQYNYCRKLEEDTLVEITEGGRFMFPSPFEDKRCQI